MRARFVFERAQMFHRTHKFSLVRKSSGIGTRFGERGNGRVILAGQGQGESMRTNAEVLSAYGNLGDDLAAAVPNEKVSRRSVLRWGASWLASTTLLGSTVPALGATANRQSANRPSTSRASREQAISRIPLRSLKEPVRRRIQDVVRKPTIYRRLPIAVIPCDPDLYLFLVRYPEVIVNMWQLMGVTKVVIKRTSAYVYEVQDGAGTESQVELVYGTRDQHLFLAEGLYDGPLLPRRVTGRCVILLSSAYSKDAQQRSYVSNRLDVFLQLDKVGIEMVAKTLHPLIGKTVDTNFAESARFVSQVSHVAETNGPGVQRLVARLNQVEPQVRTQFAQITSAINQRALLKRFGNPDEEATKRISDLKSDASLDKIADRK